MKGRLITFEGIEGSGKSTQVAYLADYLTKKGYAVVSTREPGGTTIGEALRALILHSEKEPVHPKTELFLYLADRAEHLQQIILPALEKGKIVLCDRFTDSTLIYQGYARGLSFPEMNTLLSFAADAVVPDMTFLLDLPVKKGRTRLKGRKEVNRLDREADPFHEKIRKGYLALAKKGPTRIHLINANADKETVFAQIQKVTDALLP